jgi:hypothetical protein
MRPTFPSVNFAAPDPKESLLNVSKWAAEQAAQATSEEDRRYWTARAQALAARAEGPPAAKPAK